MTEYVRPFEDIDLGDVALVGGKNASLGEMYGRLRPAGIPVPGGFATTEGAWREFLQGIGNIALAEKMKKEKTGKTGKQRRMNFSTLLNEHRGTA